MDNYEFKTKAMIAATKKAIINSMNASTASINARFPIDLESDIKTVMDGAQFHVGHVLSGQSVGTYNGQYDYYYSAKQYETMKVPTKDGGTLVGFNYFQGKLYTEAVRQGRKYQGGFDDVEFVGTGARPMPWDAFQQG